MSYSAASILSNSLQGKACKPPSFVSHLHESRRLGQIFGGVTSDIKKQLSKKNTPLEIWKIMFLSKWVICRFHVNLPGRRKLKPPPGNSLLIIAPLTHSSRHLERCCKIPDFWVEKSCIWKPSTISLGSPIKRSLQTTSLCRTRHSAVPAILPYLLQLIFGIQHSNTFTS